MELMQRIEEALREAIRSRRESGRNAVRLLLTALKVREKEVKRPLEEPEIRQLISSQIKQRRDSAEQYLRGGRKDLAALEEEEIEVLSVFLPEQLTPEALDGLIETAIAESGAQTVKEMGKVMKLLMPKVAGRAEGKLVNDLTRRKLSS
ncbi:MAG: GatB/YqeY domain-containing protein [Syntrophobacteraceae bacterium]|jgi:hypothetical protein|nr:GatB/YqeY domain-containing protein [Syntrophobacteraceae bacterium]